MILKRSQKVAYTGFWLFIWLWMWQFFLADGCRLDPEIDQIEPIIKRFNKQIFNWGQVRNVSYTPTSKQYAIINSHRDKSMISARTQSSAIKCCVIDAGRWNNYFHMLIIIQKLVVEGKNIYNLRHVIITVLELGSSGVSKNTWWQHCTFQFFSTVLWS